jgi:hypothetical protein
LTETASRGVSIIMLTLFRAVRKTATEHGADVLAARANQERQGYLSFRRNEEPEQDSDRSCCRDISGDAELQEAGAWQLSIL